MHRQIWLKIYRFVLRPQINLLLFPSTACQLTESRGRHASAYQHGNEKGAPARCHESKGLGGSAESLMGASRDKMMVQVRADEFFVTSEF